jgi:hypothetical protein
MPNRLLWVVWPAFLGACVLELIVFALVDPQDLSWGAYTLEWSRQAIYTAAFFVFWIVTLGACALATLLGPSSERVGGSGQNRIAS